MVEFRLYYDDDGEILFYTCEQPEGKYIVIDAQTYAECRSDVKIVDNKIVKKNNGTMISKLVPSINGTKCSTSDINIIIEDLDDFTIWNIKRYEFKYN